MSKYTKEQIEDVAQVLARWTAGSLPYHMAQTMREIVGDFADLLAADNPPTCPYCGTTEVGICLFQRGLVSHDPANFTGGFDRITFLADCGLKPEQPDVDRSMAEKT